MSPRIIRINKRLIGERQPIFIIAEAGVNHNGNLNLAKKLVDIAKDANADAVKFQTFNAEKLVTRYALLAEYQRKNFKKISQLEMLKKLELPKSDFEKLKNYCDKEGITFLSTPFDEESASYLVNRLKIKLIKVSSCDLTNIHFLSQIAKYGKPIILSTGMSTLAEIKEAVKAIYLSGNKRLILLHCTTNYPTRFEEVNLKAMETLKQKFSVPVGYSDHSQGIEVAVAASAMGACVIEKHFTLDKSMPGPDHAASLEPPELKKMIESVRNIEMALGDGIKKPKESEIEIKKIVRKSIVAAVDISKGIRITEAMLTIKRPGTGIEPKLLNRVLGRMTKKNIFKDEILTWNSLA